ncbi:thioredoxin family protein [Ramlibacter sp.]|uniref:thioredoxin family protein n=1 Tax=Ramlibacter sp. TaxID=1917967 RepID=UPI002C0056C5|nr:thioredoxin family protein [Ramlibacter sp.]HWI81951.1 thioredoxin family protein [Ramlibacter sp.]
MEPTADEPGRDHWVICLCAQWCGVCREWRPAFERAAAGHPSVRFAWVDVEDEAAAMGDVDVETFPTLLIAAAGRPVFFGPVLPAAAQFDRLLATVLASGARPTGITPEVAELFPRLAGMLRN